MVSSSFEKKIKAKNKYRFWMWTFVGTRNRPTGQVWQPSLCWSRHRCCCVWPIRSAVDLVASRHWSKRKRSSWQPSWSRWHEHFVCACVTILHSHMFSNTQDMPKWLRNAFLQRSAKVSEMSRNKVILTGKEITKNMQKTYFLPRVRHFLTCSYACACVAADWTTEWTLDRIRLLDICTVVRLYDTFRKKENASVSRMMKRPVTMKWRAQEGPRKITEQSTNLCAIACAVERAIVAWTTCHSSCICTACLRCECANVEPADATKQNFSYNCHIDVAFWSKIRPDPSAVSILLFGLPGWAP